MYVCMYVCIYVCMHVWMYVCMSLQTILSEDLLVYESINARTENQSKDLKLGPHFEEPNYCMQLHCEVFSINFEVFRKVLTCPDFFK